MTLRRKLLTLLIALATTAMLLVGAGFWATSTQQAAHEEMELHLFRSLLIQRIGSTGQVLLRGQFAAVVADTPGARVRFQALEAGVRDDLERWAAMPETEEQARRRTGVVEAFEAALEEIHATFRLLDGGQPEVAMERLLAYDRAAPFRAFREAIAEQEDADLSERASIRARVERTRETVQIGLSVAAVAVLSLVFLFAAYLSGEVFRPLHDLRDALDAAGRGERSVRLEEGRDDELGATARSFNRLMDALERGDANASGGEAGRDARAADLDARRRLVDARSVVDEIFDSSGDSRSTDELRGEIERILEGAYRAARVGSSAGLALEREEVSSLLHAVASVFSIELGARGVGIEIYVDSEARSVLADGARLRAALVEITRHSIASLPAHGGRIGLRAIPDLDDEGFILVEIADDGPHGDPRRYERALTRAGEAPRDPAETSLGLAFDVVAEHGGRVEIDATPGSGTRIFLRLPTDVARERGSQAGGRS